MSDITRSEIDALGGKLDDFAQGLPDTERQVLGWIIARAQAADEDDVKGFALASNNINDQLASASGLSRGNPVESVTVSWSW
jgi:hypothetical protein